MPATDLGVSTLHLQLTIEWLKADNVSQKYFSARITVILEHQSKEYVVVLLNLLFIF